MNKDKEALRFSQGDNTEKANRPTRKYLPQRSWLAEGY